MKRSRLLFLILTVLMLSLVIMIPSSYAEDSDESVTILFTHDLHDNFYPFNAVVGGETKSVGGYARLYSAIKEEREKDPDALLIDAGDYSMGTLFQTINTYDAPELRIMGLMGYDVTTFGNHEFDYRAEGLAKSLQSAVKSGEDLPEIVASNIIFPKEDDGNLTPSLQSLKDAMDDYGVLDYKIMDRNGLKIALFGLMGKEASDDAPMSGVEFEDIVEASQTVVDTIKDKEDPDLIIALSHSGTSDDPAQSEDEVLADKVSGIDVIISGHSHTVLDEPILIDDTIVVSSGEYGKNLGTLNISRDQSNGWQVDEYNVVPIDDKFPEDPMISEKIESFRGMVDKEYLDHFGLEFDEVIARSPFDFMAFSELGKEQAEAPIGNLIGDAFIHTVKNMEGENYEPITAAVAPVGTIRDSIVEGDITVSDVFNISPLGIGPSGVPGYPLVSIYLTGKELKAVAEVDASVTPLMPDVQLYIAGLSYTFNPNRLIFNKVTDVKLDNLDGTYDEIDNDKLYRLVSGLYSAQMLPVVEEKSFGLLSIVPKTKDGTPISDFEKEILYMDDNNEQELKEWYAFANYLESFDKVDGIAQIPEFYETAHDRKVVTDSKNVINLVKKPNGIALTVYGIAVAVIAIFVLIITWIVRRRKRKRHLIADSKERSS